MSKSIGWGILGTGNIARQFAAGVRTCRRGKLLAVASRQEDSARTFAQSHAVPVSYSDYDALLRDPQVDVVYISLPNTLHHHWTLQALRAGKHVLCEKPIAANAAQAEEMFDAAEKAGRILVEAFMFRAHPQTHAILHAIRQGVIGQLQLIRSSFCYRTTRLAGNIRFDPALAGGALMDIGCYCINLSRLLAGAEPTGISAFGKLHASGVDEMAVGSMRFPGDVLASFTCGMQVQADNTAYLCGTEGYIEVPWPWKPQPTAAFTIARSIPPRQDLHGKPAAIPTPPPRETRTVEAGMDLYGIEADDIAATILDGKPPLMSRHDTLGNMQVLDEMRRQIGVRF